MLAFVGNGLAPFHQLDDVFVGRDWRSFRLSVKRAFVWREIAAVANAPSRCRFTILAFVGNGLAPFHQLDDVFVGRDWRSFRLSVKCAFVWREIAAVANAPSRCRFTILAFVGNGLAPFHQLDDVFVGRDWRSFRLSVKRAFVWREIAAVAKTSCSICRQS